MIIKLFKKIFVDVTYQVIEQKTKPQASFTPQHRKGLGAWQNVVVDGYLTIPERFYTLEEANKFLFKFQQKKAKVMEPVEIAHPFDAVFYKLSNTKTKKDR